MHVTGLTDGDSYTFTATAANAGGTSPASPASAPVTPAAAVTATVTPAGVVTAGVIQLAGGEVIVTSAGNVYATGTAWHGSPHAARVTLGGRVIGIAAGTGGGYLVATTAGNVYNYGTAF